MRSRSRQIVVEVSPTRHQLALYEHATLIGRRESQPVEGPGLSDWAAVLRALEADLGTWVQELGVAGEPAVVLYAGPDTTASLFEAPTSAGEHRARQAARLAMADTTAFPLEQNAHQERCIFRDGSAREGEHPKIRTLAIADTESTVLSLSTVIERAGLIPGRFVPAPGAILAAAVDDLRRRAARGQGRVVLWVGEHASVIAGGEGDRLHFARLINVGSEMLVEAIAGGAGLARTGKAVALDRRSARELLAASGVPSPDGWLDETTSIDPGAILPVLQPVLQRLVVETKQSIRFGFAAESRGSVTLSLAGPGAGIAGLGEAIATGVGVVLEKGHAPAQGDLVSLLARGADFPSLATREANASNTTRASRRAIAVGAALALAAIGIHAGESWQRLGEARETLSVLSGTSGSDSGVIVAVRSAMEAKTGLSRAESARRAYLGQVTPDAEMLRVIGALTPEGVSITEMTLLDDEEGARVTLRGVAHADDAMTDSERFSAYTAALGACPLVTSTTLGETRRSVGGSEQMLSFNLTLKTIRLPAEIRTAAAPTTEGETP